MGLYNRNEERVHAKKEVGLSIVERGEKRYIWVHFKKIEERVY